MNKRIFSVILALTMLLSSLVLFVSCGNDETPAETSENSEALQESTSEVQLAGSINPLTGITGYEEGYEGQKFVGIVVENSPDARPQWGMSTPDILMEYEVEGGITRMLWLYANASRVPEKVGPVRSARHDIVELALGYDMLFVHCGGSDYAYDKLDAHPELDEIDGLYYDGCFFRETTRNTASEHRLCLVGSDLVSSITSKGIDMTVDAAKAVPFNFVTYGTQRSMNGVECSSFSFQYSSSYKYAFNLNASTGLYECSLNGKNRVDDQGVQCAYTNVVILYVDMSQYSDYGHQDLHLENGGKGVYISGGVKEEITWSKPTETDMLKMYTSDGNELQLNCGTSYIGFVRSTNAPSDTVG